MKFSSNKFFKISFVENMYLPMLFINDTMLIITRYNYAPDTTTRNQHFQKVTFLDIF